MELERIIKYFNNELTEEEMHDLFDWIEENPKHREEFKKLKIAWALAVEEHAVNKPDATNIIQLAKKNRRESIKRLVWGIAISTAACMLLFFGIKSIFSGNNQNNQLVLPDQSVVVTTPDGAENKIRDKDTLFQNGQMVAIYNPDSIRYMDNISEAIKFKIEVPYGKTFKVTLPDGSTVHLNAGSRLKYKQNEKQSLRLAELEGEGFFHVAKYKKMPFTVRTHALNVQVLGTKFNVKSSLKNSNPEVILTEGSVEIHTRIKSYRQVIMEPGEKVTFHMRNGKLSKKSVSDYNELSWRYGEIRMNRMNSTELFSKLENYYGVEIVNRYDTLRKTAFSGSLDLKNHTITELLDLLNLDTRFEYFIRNGKIIITNPNN